MKKIDECVYEKMWAIGDGMPVTVVELYHYVKNDDKFYKILGKDKNKLEDRRQVTNYNYAVPLLKKSLARLQSQDRMSEPRKIDRNF